MLIANTGGDRLIDWVGEFNSYLVPFAPFGLGTVSRQVPPALYEFLYMLSAAQGADFTIAQLSGAMYIPRNGEPYGEIGRRHAEGRLLAGPDRRPARPAAGQRARRQARRAALGGVQHGHVARSSSPTPACSRCRAAR